jgi:hypothetical protein
MEKEKGEERSVELSEEIDRYLSNRSRCTPRASPLWLCLEPGS